jgi:hypothetical protein
MRLACIQVRRHLETYIETDILVLVLSRIRFPSWISCLVSTGLQGTKQTESVPHKHESTDTMLYTYQTQTLKPVCMADPTVSLMELIDAAHVGVPHVAREFLSFWSAGQALFGYNTTRDRSHGSLSERDDSRTSRERPHT